MATQHATNNQSTPTWTEPPWSGWIETTGDALLILEAARRGLIPRVTRRLVDSERKMITSGSVFVFDEDESGIKRWTDGFFWSPSRILGNFLLYRETDRRASGHRTGKDNEIAEFDGSKNDGSLSRPKSDPGHPGVDKQRERTLVGSLTNSYKFKPDGLMKKTFSLTIGGVAQHLISYYKIEDVESGRLRPPSSLPELASLEISPEYLDKTHFRNPPKVEMGTDGILRYRGEADDIDTSTPLLTGPPLTGLPLLTDGREVPENAAPKRVKRFEPYGTPNTAAPKRSRKTPTAKTVSEQGESSQSHQAQSQQDIVTTPISGPSSPQQAQPPQPFSDPIPSASPSPAQTATVTSYTSFGAPPYYGYMQPPHMYPHQPSYPGLPATQPLPPPTHPGQYQYSAYPPPVPAPQAPVPSNSHPVVPSSNSPISPSDPSQSQAPVVNSSSPQPQVQSQAQTTASTPPQMQPQPGYYHPPVHPHPYYAPPPSAPAPHPQLYPGYPPPPPSASHSGPPPVWGPPPHPYGAYPPPHPQTTSGAPPPQSYSYGVYPPPQQPGHGQYQQPYQPQQPHYVHQGQGYAVYGQKPDQAQGPPESEALKTNGKATRELEREGSGMSE